MQKKVSFNYNFHGQLEDTFYKEMIVLFLVSSKATGIFEFQFFPSEGVCVSVSHSRTLLPANAIHVLSWAHFSSPSNHHQGEFCFWPYSLAFWRLSRFIYLASISWIVQILKSPMPLLSQHEDSCFSLLATKNHTDYVTRVYSPACVWVCKALMCKRLHIVLGRLNFDYKPSYVVGWGQLGEDELPEIRAWILEQEKATSLPSTAYGAILIRISIVGTGSRDQRTHSAVECVFRALRLEMHFPTVILL